jgi:hypothetical protein
VGSAGVDCYAITRHQPGERCLWSCQRHGWQRQLQCCMHLQPRRPAFARTFAVDMSCQHYVEREAVRCATGAFTGQLLDTACMPNPE